MPIPPWLIILPFFATFLLLSRKGVAPSSLLFERLIWGAAMTISLLTFLMVGLMSGRIWRTDTIFLSCSVCTLVAALIPRSSKRVLTEKGGTFPRISVVSAISIIAVCGFAIIFRLKPSSYLFGGQDPGVYFNTGNLIAQHGSHIYTDTTLSLVRDDPTLFRYYLENSYLHADPRPDGSWSGNLVAGLYLLDVEKGEHVTQFYPATQTWLALGSLLFGRLSSTWILLPFSLLSIAAVGLLTLRLTSSLNSAIVASALLAISPPHAAVGTSPFSEATASYFFITGLCLLVISVSREGRPLGGHSLVASALCFGALFFSRITGFLTLPLILISITGVSVATKSPRIRRHMLLFGLSLGGLYLLSFIWGLSYCFPYARDIYRGKLKIDPHHLHLVAPLIVGSILFWAALHCTTSRWRPLFRSLRRYRSSLGNVIVISALALIIWRGYKLGFTDTFQGHRWFDRRWHMAGHGWESVPYLSIVVLSLLLSPPVFCAGLCGISHSFRGALTTLKWIPVSVTALGFILALTLKQLTVPYLYFYARYQVSELLPLMIVLSCCFFFHGMRRFSLLRNQPKAEVACWFLYLALSASFLVKPAYGRLQRTEGMLFSQALECIDELSRQPTIIMIDKFFFPESPVVLPLRLTYNKNTFAFRRKDFADDAQLKSLFDFFGNKGYAVLLISSQNSWASSPWFTKIGRFMARMRKFGGKKGSYVLPFRYSEEAYPLRVFRYHSGDKPLSGDREPLPKACQGL